MLGNDVLERSCGKREDVSKSAQILLAEGCPIRVRTAALPLSGSSDSFKFVKSH